ncbi:hypothetical protein ACHAQA_006246 [Verticillium albo-atrum]
MASVSHPRAGATTPPAPQPQTPPAKDQDDEDNSIILTRDQQQQLDRFRDDVYRCRDLLASERLCIELRDELLDQHGGQEIFVAAVERFMVVASTEYRQWKTGRSRFQKPLPVSFREDNFAPWDRFLGLATIGALAKARCLVALKEVARRWGRSMVLHYELVSGGEEYCHQFHAAARVIPSFDEAVVGLNRCIQNRAGTTRLRLPRDSTNPIDLEDLHLIMAWWESGIYPQRHLHNDDLPAGYGFDDFHLMVPRDYVVLPIKTSGSSLASWPEESPITPMRPGLDDAVAAAPEWSNYLTKHVRPYDTTLASPEMTDRHSTPSSAGSLDGRQDLGLGHQPLPNNGSADPRCVCPVDVPSLLLLALDMPSAFTPALATRLAPFMAKLCRPHLLQLVEHTTSTVISQQNAHSVDANPPPKIPTELSGQHTPQRTMSLCDLDEHRVKRQRVEDSSVPPQFEHKHQRLHDRGADEAYRKQVLHELKQKVDSTILPQGTHGEGTDALIRKLLEKARPPNTAHANGIVELLFCSADQAEALVDFESPNGAPIVTDCQQQFRWNTRERPIAQFLRRMGNLDRFISVQIPSRSATTDSFEVRRLSEVRSRYLAEKETSDPWNILDLQSPLPSSILPSFLTGENCQLLLQVRDTVLMEESAERVVASSQQWNEWRNVLEWVLMSQGGHNTAPHMDSHGFSTWITAQEGSIGFGWLSNPTDEERAAWTADPTGYTGGRWRFIVLKPGQTVFFISGTIHFVFRIRKPQTLALGGHVLQWSGLERWMSVVLTQMENPSITNEDMGPSASKYVGIVSRLVSAKVEEEKASGVEVEDRVQRFLDSVKIFNKAYGKKRRSTTGSKKRAR